MTRKITYPLIIAIGLSPVAGALYEGEEGQIHVHTLEGWLITGELYQEPVCEECEDYEWCSTYLKTKRYQKMMAGVQKHSFSCLTKVGYNSCIPKLFFIEC